VTAETVHTRQGDTVDMLLWRTRGSTAGLTERTLELNPGLADRGPVLPAGLPVILPAAAAPASVRETVKLWD
jgi:phage tail protein X